jgi:hypothetical protein
MIVWPKRAPKANTPDWNVANSKNATVSTERDQKLLEERLASACHETIHKQREVFMAERLSGWHETIQLLSRQSKPSIPKPFAKQLDCHSKHETLRACIPL